MAGVNDRNQSLKDVLVESLYAVLSPQHDVRVAGEEQVKALEVTEEFGVHLAELAVDPTGALAVRQLASVLLKQYVEAHWSQLSEKFRGPEPPETAKERIRQLLPNGLSESISKVRATVAYAVSAIAHWDWPDQWPHLFNILMQALTSGSADAVHGAMRVLTEFTQDISDTQMSQVAPVILPEMLNIFLQAETYGVRTRSRAVRIFNTCTSMIAAVAELHKGMAKQLLYPVLPRFTQALIESLSVPDGPTSDSGLKMEVVKAVTTLVKNFPKAMSQWLQQLLTPIWTIFTQSADFYVRTVVNNTDEANDPVDSDGEVLGFENLVYSIFEFVHALIDTSKFRGTLKKSVDQILYFIILYMQMTQDQVSLWSTNPDQFVEDEDDETFSYSVRISAQDLLLTISTEFQTESAPALCLAVQKHLQESNGEKHSGNPNWWKVHESCMLSLGSVKQLLIDAVKEGKVQFDFHEFLMNVVLADMNSSVSPFLIGRCLWTASRYTEVMSQELLQNFLQATVGGLHHTQPSSIRISSIRAVYGYCIYLKNCNNTHLLVPFLPSVLEGLVTVATQFSSEVLALCMETLAVVLSVDPSFTSNSEARVAPLTISVFLKHCGDPLIVSLTQDIFKELAANEACNGPLQQRLIPTLTSILNAQSDKVPVGLPGVALDVLEAVVRACKPPLSVPLIQSAFPAAVNCTLSADDNSTLQSGGECLRAFASVAMDQIIEWKDERGTSGLSYIIQIINKLLDPKTSEYTASFVGKLISVVISRVGNKLGENLDLILRAVLSKMQQAETLSVMQSLVMIFAHLMTSQIEAILDFLSTVPGPTGKPALEFVLSEWCSRQHLFYGAYERKISAVALCKILQQVISTNDARIKNIQVQGDQIFQPNEGIKTRSKSSKAPEQWTTIPVVVKIYKLLLNELSNQLESNMSTQANADEEFEDEEDEGWEEEENGDIDDDVAASGTYLNLLDQYGGDYAGFTLDDVEEDDPDALSDPNNQVDLQSYLTEFIQSLSQLPCYQMFSSHHTDLEKQVLRTINIAA